ncbi:hypothetical protein CIT26_09575 [Mesorhizobium temperatum]|uniref:Uncharacterized protein n=1 Tax=Mesorhizobium temperatum TaxID=241416 RepID=A0A271LSR8_9HYPH|nr:hypothetical protein CIT26_09575 [Mesorhizobium temperatum]
MLALRLQEIEKIDEAEVPPCPYPSDIMLQCERQASAKPAGFYNRLRKSDAKKTCGSMAT